VLGSSYQILGVPKRIRNYNTLAKWRKPKEKLGAESGLLTRLLKFRILFGEANRTQRILSKRLTQLWKRRNRAKDFYAPRNEIL